MFTKLNRRSALDLNEVPQEPMKTGELALACLALQPGDSRAIIGLSSADWSGSKTGFGI